MEKTPTVVLEPAVNKLPVMTEPATTRFGFVVRALASRIPVDIKLADSVDTLSILAVNESVVMLAELNTLPVSVPVIKLAVMFDAVKNPTLAVVPTRFPLTTFPITLPRTRTLPIMV